MLAIAVLIVSSLFLYVFSLENKMLEIFLPLWLYGLLPGADVSEKEDRSLMGCADGMDEATLSLSESLLGSLSKFGVGGNSKSLIL